MLTQVLPFQLSIMPHSVPSRPPLSISLCAHCLLLQVTFRQQICLHKYRGWLFPLLVTTWSGTTQRWTKWQWSAKKTVNTSNNKKLYAIISMSNRIRSKHGWSNLKLPIKRFHFFSITIDICEWGQGELHLSSNVQATEQAMPSNPTKAATKWEFTFLQQNGKE